ncbi:hypothetical protein IP91_00433 [Pseudoduganella lurida]|uniref:Uncharacterized protein n=1 Tax=Pseudoduganella lurida TaxID=1036180 RepID=A0A562RJY1_9BURK|nr:hypothetical protein [Pseudoduganella lurida]TWI69365.1 hypothetical protein IP91_00433 [Pseudoduganella lurida]
MNPFAIRCCRILSLAFALDAGITAIAHAAAAPCTPPPPDALATSWQAFRAAALAGDPVKVAAHYRFPLKLLPAYDDGKPLVIARPVFLHNYAVLFRQGPADSEIALYTALKKSKGAEKIPAYVFDTARCQALARIADYEFSYRRDSGWKIGAVFYAGDYDMAKYYEVDRIVP